MYSQFMMHGQKNIDLLFTLGCGNIFVRYWYASEGPEGTGGSCIVWSGGWVGGCQSGPLL